MAYSVISFNLKNIYGSPNFRTNRDWATISKILLDERADIVAIQEVFSELPIKHLCKKMNCGFFCDWRYRMVSRETCRNVRGEGYAILWNAKRVDLTPKEMISSDGRKTIIGTHEPEIRTEWSRSLVRPPCVARFVPVGWCVPFIELRIITTHIICHKDARSRAIGNELGEMQMRKEEYRTLSEKLFPRVGKNRTDGNFRPAYTFIVGDYNLLHGECEIIDHEYKSEVKFMKTRQMLASTIYTGKTEDDPGGYTKNDFDHVSHSDREDPYVQIVERVDAPSRYYNSNFKEYEKRLSDHVPIRMLFDIRHVNT